MNIITALREISRSNKSIDVLSISSIKKVALVIFALFFVLVVGGIIFWRRRKKSVPIKPIPQPIEQPLAPDYSKLIDAIKRSSITALEAALKVIEPDLTDENGVPLLCFAIKQISVFEKNYALGDLPQEGGEEEVISPAAVVDRLIKIPECSKVKTDPNGQGPLHYASKNSPDFFKDLIVDGKCDVNAQDADGNTALHILVQKNLSRLESGDADIHLQNCAEGLLRHAENLNVDLKNAEGKTPFSYALEKGYRGLFKQMWEKSSKKTNELFTSDEFIKIAKEGWIVDDLEIQWEIVNDSEPEEAVEKKPVEKALKAIYEAARNWGWLEVGAFLKGKPKEDEPSPVQQDPKPPKMTRRTPRIFEDYVKSCDPMRSRSNSISIDWLMHRTSEGNNRLHEAVLKNDPKQVVSICNYLKEHPGTLSLDAENADKQTPLQLAIALPNTYQVFTKLLAYTDKSFRSAAIMQWLSFKGSDGNNRLHEAVLSDDPEQVEYVYSQSMLPHLSALNNEGQTPLKLAIAEHKTRALSKLLEYVGDRSKGQALNDWLQQKDSDGNHQLHVAVLSHDLKQVIVISEFLKKYVRHSDLRNNNGQTPLELAARCDDLDIFKTLFNDLDKDSKIAFMNKCASQTNSGDNNCLHQAALANDEKLLEDMLQHLKEAKDKLSLRNKDGLTPLELAAKHNRYRAFTVLLDKVEADLRDKVMNDWLKYTNQDGYNRLHEAVLDDDPERVVSICKYLSSRGNNLLEARNKAGQTPLKMAAQFFKNKSFETLLEYVTQDSMNEARDYVCSSWMFQLLKGRGVDLDEKDEDGNTMLHRAIIRKDKRMVLALAGVANVDTQNNLKETPLILAAKKKQEGLIKAILTTGTPNVNLQDRIGNSALHYVAMHGLEGIVIYFRLHGANFTLKNEEGETPIAYGQKFHYNIEDCGLS